MNKILVEYNLDELSFHQLRSMVNFLKQSGQHKNLKAVNDHMIRMESHILRRAEDSLFPEMKTKKSLWQKLIGK